MVGLINDLLVQLTTSITSGNPQVLLVIFCLAVSADLGFPFPFLLDALLFFTVYKVGPVSLPVFLVVLMLFCGRMAGTGSLYWASRLLGAKFVDWVKRHSRFIARNLERFPRSSSWPVLAIVAGRLTPGLMQVATVAAGSLQVSYFRLVLSIVLSSIIYDGTLVVLGTLARLGFKNVKPQDSVWVLVGFVVVMVAAFVLVHLIRSQSSSTNRHRPGGPEL
jgi:membrane protein DedA with SNARE-associated domain